MNTTTAEALNLEETYMVDLTMFMQMEPIYNVTQRES